MVTLVESRREIALPEGVSVNVVDDTHVTVKGPKGELTRSFPDRRVHMEKTAQGVSVHSPLPRKKQKAMVGTVEAHINNMVRGVTHGFKYQMKIVFSHFPIKTVVKNDIFEIQNFLGERSARLARILDGVKVAAKGDAVTVEGIDVEKVGQTAANIETATRVRDRDTRVFQDGIYIVSKEA